MNRPSNTTPTANITTAPGYGTLTSTAPVMPPDRPVIAPGEGSGIDRTAVEAHQRARKSGGLRRGEEERQDVATRVIDADAPPLRLLRDRDADDIERGEIREQDVGAHEGAEVRIHVDCAPERAGSRAVEMSVDVEPHGALR